MPAPVAKLEGISDGQPADRVRELLRRRHGCALNEYRDNPKVPFQGGLDLQSNKISIVIKTSMASHIGGAQPVLADDGNAYLAGAHRLPDRFGEVSPCRDRVDVHENRLATETGAQCVVQAAGVAGGVVTPVTDEDARDLACRVLRNLRRSDR